ncbi:hypothetical protein J1N35_023778 [Gossypium stocksii]|uniref:Uncharacterized protein n=1 Tax=Gossypium stocksii TaxID=47602 RepID=A0A9D3VKM9_9ROSI|nr:hypothetical protein J1N35_023778 [Gossypium stocksii]
MEFLHRPNAVSLVSRAMDIIQSSPPTWQSAVLSNLLIFVVGTPLLVAGLSLSGICAAFLLGTLTWPAFGSPGFLLVASYFVIMVWGDWEALRAVFQHGMSGSGILVTTHEHSVAEAMELSYLFCLGKLSDEFCWMILREVGLNDNTLEYAVEDIGKV